MLTDPDLRRSTTAIIIAVLTASIIGWGSWITTYAMTHRERIVSLERCAEYDRRNIAEVKDKLDSIQGTVNNLYGDIRDRWRVSDGKSKP